MTMTSHSRRTAQASLDRVTQCLDSQTGTATWWACVARHIDELSEELELSDNVGLVAQVTEDTPELAAGALRLRTLDAQVRSEVAQLRLLVANRAGSFSAVAEVSEAVVETLRRVRTLDRVADDLMLDAYERDFGGESS